MRFLHCCFETASIHPDKSQCSGDLGALETVWKLLQAGKHWWLRSSGSLYQQFLSKPDHSSSLKEEQRSALESFIYSWTWFGRSWDGGQWAMHEKICTSTHWLLQWRGNVIGRYYRTELQNSKQRTTLKSFCMTITSVKLWNNLREEIQQISISIVF